MNAFDIDRFSRMSFGDGLTALWDFILATVGEESLAKRSFMIRCGDYAIPRAHAVALMEAWIASASPDDRAAIALQWVNIGPSSF
ncbi:MAG: hypothetical protein H0X04_00005 [Chthoniobacterales bacterium]|nr:hypothetical protein [Chthoniobacterales bacterium]